MTEKRLRFETAWRIHFRQKGIHQNIEISSILDNLNVFINK